MKSYKAFALSLFAITLASTTQAQTTIYLTGSTSYRSQTVLAIYNLMSANGPVNGAVVQGKAANSGNAVILSGTVSGLSGTTTVSCSWSGAAAGVLAVGAVAQGSAPTITAPYIVDSGPGAAVLTPITSVSTVNNGTNTYPGGAAITDPTVSGNPNTQHQSVIAMSEAFQVSTPFPKNLILTSQDGLNNQYKMANLKDNVVGVSPYTFVASKGSAAAGANGTGFVTGMTPQLAQGLWGTATGQEPLSLFTGNNADSAKIVYATGRNPDGGVRINAFAETGVGIASVVSQWQPTIVGGSVTSVALFPATTLFNVFPVAQGNNGESSSSNLATDLAGVCNDSTGYLIGYMGTTDAVTALNSGAVELAYNGVSLPVSGSQGSYSFSNYALIENGQYTFWGYEHLDYNTSVVIPTGSSQNAYGIFATALISEIKTVTALIPLSAMKVGRQIEGGVITLGNPY